MQPDLPALFKRLPPPFEEAFDPAAPWALLGAPLGELLDRIQDDHIQIRLQPDIHLSGDRIAIGKGARIYPGAVIEGPIWIGEDVEIRPGAYLRGGVWLGDRSIVGASTEVKHSILFPGARAPHLNYIGDSILGERVNLGAGTILSNFRHDGAEIEIKAGTNSLRSNRNKLGAVLGDGVLTGCNCVLHPGTIVGRETHLYPGVQLRSGIYPEQRLIKLRQTIETVERRLD